MANSKNISLIDHAIKQFKGEVDKDLATLLQVVEEDFDRVTLKLEQVQETLIEIRHRVEIIETRLPFSEAQTAGEDANVSPASSDPAQPT